MARAIEVILTNDVEALGHFGEKKRVKMGFARNFLIPRGLALPADDASAMRQFEDIRKREEKRRAKVKAELETVLKKVNGQKITLTQKSHDGGKLYGSVSVADVIDAIKTTFKVELTDKQVLLKDHIKEVGDYKVKIKLFHEVEGSVQVVVVAEENSEEPAEKPVKAKKRASKKNQEEAE